jgi:hypothetical protein
MLECRDDLEALIVRLKAFGVFGMGHTHYQVILLPGGEDGGSRREL